MIRFQTNRLLIRDISDEDLNFLLKIYEKEENMRFISDGKYGWTIEQLTKKYEKCNKMYNIGLGIFTVCIKSTNKVIGEAGLFDSYGDLNKIELGYILDSTYWGKGFGEEICSGLINYSFDKLNVETIISKMYTDNIASVKLAEKCGMKRMIVGETITKKSYFEYEISKFKSSN